MPSFKRIRYKSHSPSRTLKRSRRCASGYVRNKKSGNCVYATGRIGRKLNKARAARKKSHKRSGRPSPNVSATLFSIGHQMRGHDGNLWKIKQTSKGIKRWIRA